MKVKCEKCSGYYILRAGKYGEFGGCSNYPNCKSTIEVPNLIFRFFVQEGIEIYKWEKVCYKCNKKTEVYSYFLYYQLERLDKLYSISHGLGIGDIMWIDNVLKKKIPTIKDSYSTVIKSTYTANICQHCGSLQGKNYVVDDPHEIYTELFHEKTMNKFLNFTIPVKETNTDLKNEFYKVFAECKR